jgi:hypothetical protein
MRRIITEYAGAQAIVRIVGVGGDEVDGLSASSNFHLQHPVSSPDVSFGNRRLPLLILASYCCAAVLYAVSAPLLDVSDEPRHYAYVHHLANGGALPVQRIGQEESEAPWHQEGSQPPLYYVLMSLLVRPIDRSDFAEFWQFNPHAQLGRADSTHNLNQMLHGEAERFPWRGTALAVMLIRFVSAAFGAIAVACAYGVAREFRPGDARLPLLAAALVAFNPMFVHIMASVNNDTLAAALSSAALLLGARMLRRGADARTALLLGLTLGGAALTKASGLALAISVPAFVLWGELRRRAPLRRLLVVALAIALPTAALAGWFYARNWLLYGDPTGTQMMAAIAGPRIPNATLLEIAGEWRSFLTAYIGMFGAVNIPIPQWMYLAFEVALVCAGVGLLLEVRDARRRTNADAAGARIALLCAAALAVAFAALLRWTSITLASQGRLLFPVIVAIALLTATGLLRLEALVRTPWPTRAVAAALAALTFASPFAYLRPAYAEPARLTSEVALPADLTRTELRYADAVRWIGFRVNTPRQRVAPGELLDVTLYWQALRPIERNLSAFVKIFGPGDVELVGIDTYPGGGMYQTTRWQAGEIIADRYRLRLPERVTATLPTLLRLDVGFYDFAIGPVDGLLATYDGSGAPTGRQRYAAASLAASGADEPAVVGQPSVSAAAVQVTARRVDARTVELDAVWTVTVDVDAEYTVFAHLFDAQGNKVGQNDGPAAGGDFPARWWRRGDRVRDVRRITVEDDLAPGEYVVKFGLYRPEGAYERMPAFDAAGSPAPESAIMIVVQQ